MGYDGSLKFDTKIDTSGFTSGITKLGSLASKGLAILGGAIAGVTASLGAGAIAGIKYNASIETYQTSFEVMTGSASKAAEIIQRLKKVGADTPFELTNLADTTQLLMNYGFTADEAMDKMMMLGDISQGSADKMSRIATAYGQMSSAGKVSLEDVKQMIEAGFNPLQEISESTGESMASLYDRISKGTISVDEITASMERATSAGGKYFESMNKQSQTFDGLVSTLKDNALQLIGEIVEPISASMTETLLPSAIEALEELTRAFREDGVEGLIEAGSEILVNLLAGIAESLPSVIETAAQIIQSFVENINENLPRLLELGGQILLSVVQGISLLLPSIGQLGANIISTLLTALSENAPQILMQAMQMMTEWLNNIRTHLPEVMNSGQEIISNLLQGLVDNAPQILLQAATMLLAFVKTIGSLLAHVVHAGLEIIVSLLSGILSKVGEVPMEAATMVANFITEIIDSLGEMFASGAEIVSNVVSGIQSKAGEVIQEASDMISDFMSKFQDADWISIGSNIISGIVSGVSGAAWSLVEAASSAVDNALNWVKSKLGIASPSKVFRDQVGKFMALGIGVGFEENMPLDDMDKSVEDAIVSIQKSANKVTTKKPSTTDSIVRNVTNNYTGDSMNYKTLKKVYKEALNEANTRPVQLDRRELARV